MRRAVDTLLVFLGAAAAYLALGQRTFYGVDGWMLVRRVAAGDVTSNMHLIYKPIARAAADLGSMIGASVYESMVVASAIGTALGVAAIHAAASVLGARRPQAVLVAGVAGTFPGVVFFATVVERHGPFFAFAGVTALASAWLARSPGVRSALGFALACTAAYAAHSTGVLMVAAYLPLAVAWARTGVTGLPPAPWRRVLTAAGIAALATGLGMLVARRIGVWTDVVTGEGDNFAFFLQHASVHVGRLDMLPACAWNEIVTAFAPMSLLWPLAFRDRRPQLVAWAVTTGVLVYLTFSFLILGSFDERGAYALPLAWPFAWVAVRRLHPALALLALAFAGTLAVVEVRRHDDRPLDAWAAGMRAIAGDATPYLVAASWDDFELVFLHQPGAVAVHGFYDAADARSFEAPLLLEHASLLIRFLEEREAEGRVLLLTEPGLRALRAEPDEPGQAGPLVLEVIERGFELRPVAHGAFRGYRLVPRG